MSNDYKFIEEQLTDLETHLKNELNTYINELSTEEVPLEEIASDDIRTGYFDPITYSSCPAIFIVPETITPQYENVALSGYETRFRVNLFIVNVNTTGDPRTTSYQSYRYVKAVMNLINEYKEWYMLSEDGVDMFEALGSDTSRRWAQVPIIIGGEVRY